MHVFQNQRWTWNRMHGCILFFFVILISGELSRGLIHNLPRNSSSKSSCNPSEVFHKLHYWTTWLFQSNMHTSANAEDGHQAKASHNPWSESWTRELKDIHPRNLLGKLSMGIGNKKCCEHSIFWFQKIDLGNQIIENESRIVLPSTTVLWLRSPITFFIDLFEVPLFNQINELHGGPAWQAPSSTSLKAPCTSFKKPGLRTDAIHAVVHTTLKNQYRCLGALKRSVS